LTLALQSSTRLTHQTTGCLEGSFAKNLCKLPSSADFLAVCTGQLLVGCC